MQHDQPDQTFIDSGFSLYEGNMKKEPGNHFFLVTLVMCNDNGELQKTSNQLIVHHNELLKG
jgi:hypothetical protein